MRLSDALTEEYRGKMLRVELNDGRKCIGRFHHLDSYALVLELVQGKHEQVKRETIREVAVHSTAARAGVKLGAALGGISAALFCAGVSSFPDAFGSRGVDLATILVGLLIGAVAGAIIGGLIGAMKPKYRTIYTRET